MLLLIDNYDSFTYNLYQYLSELGAQVKVVRNDAVSLDDIAAMAPENLVHFVFEDGVYFTTGGQPVPGSGNFDLATMAEGAGFAASYQFDDLEDLASELPAIMSAKGPVFVCLKVDHRDQAPEFRMGSTAQAMRLLASRLAGD